MGINVANLVDKIIVEDKLGYKSKESATIRQKAALFQYQAPQELIAVSLPAGGIFTQHLSSCNNT